MKQTNLSGVRRQALVTGAVGGIGAEITLAFAGAGIRVLAHAQSVEEADEFAQKHSSAYPNLILPIAGDLSLPKAGSDLAMRALERMGSLDIVVVNAACQLRQPYEETEEDSVLKQLQVNFVATHQMLRLLVPAMAKKGWGRVLTIGSIQQVRPNPNLTAYAASKSAQLNLVLNLAKQYARQGVCINNLAPGLIDTDRNADIKADAARYAEQLNRIPVGTAGQPEDCAQAALFMCSEAAKYITGADLYVDGGMHLL